MTEIQFDVSYYYDVIKNTRIYFRGKTKKSPITIGDYTLRFDDPKYGSINGKTLAFNDYGEILASQREQFEQINAFIENILPYAYQQDLKRYDLLYEDFPRYFQIGKEFLFVKARTDFLTIIEFGKPPEDACYQLPGEVIYQPDYRKLSLLGQNNDGTYWLLKRNCYPFYTFEELKTVTDIYQYHGRIYFNLED